MKKNLATFVGLLSILILVGCGQTDQSGLKKVEFIDTGDQTIETLEVTLGEKIVEPEVPSYGSYEFGGWYSDSRHTKPWNFNTDIVKENTKLYARWTTKVTQTLSVQIATDTAGEPVYEKQVLETTLRVNPKVVVTFALEIGDIFNTVGFEKTGITYFGLPKSNLPESLNVFSSSIYPNTGTLFEPNYDTLDLMLPDLIIIGGRSSNLHSALKLRYPNTDILDVSNTTFSFTVQREVFDNLSFIFPNLKNDLTTHGQNITNQLNELKTKTAGLDVLFLQVNGEQISVFGNGSRYGVLYSEVGFDASDPDMATLEAHGNVVSYEYVSQVNPSIIFIMDRSAAIGESGSVTQIINNALVKQTSAGKNNAIYILDPQSWYILPGGIQSTYQMLEDINQVFG